MNIEQRTAIGLFTGVTWIFCGSCAEEASTIATTAEKIRRSPNRSEVGELGPLIPFHKDAIHSVVVWTGVKRDKPKVCFWMRPSEYKGTHLVDPDKLSPDGGETGGFIDAFRVLVRGGSNFSQRLDRSVQSRIKADIPMDNGLCFDLTHPDAFKNRGKFNIANYDPETGTWVPELTEEDFALNRAAFSNAGHSAGLNYNIFCAGNVQLPDGRILFIGGHDVDGNNGIRKLNIFDPVTEKWVHRPAPPVKEAYLANPDPTSPHPDANIEVNTDPHIPSDMKYQRWYPSAATLPDGRVIILSGTDESSEDPTAPQVQTVTPEIYDPVTDRTIALEGARKLLVSTYPLIHVVQTGPRKKDWKVAVVGEAAAPISPIPSGQVPSQELWNGKTFLLDVQAAERDRGAPGERHWKYVDTALGPHHAAGSAALWELDHRGRPRSQKVVAFGGSDGENTVATVEMIDYQDRHPRWERQEDLVQPVEDNFATALPDGNVLVVGGESPEGTTPRYSLFYQMFNPKTGTIKRLVQTSVPRKDHTTSVLLPDATVLVAGSDRTELVPDDLIPGVEGDRDVGVPVAQIYKPPYLFRGPRPVIVEAPEEIAYGGSFRVKVSTEGHARSRQIESVVLMRPSPVTHKWDWESRRIELAFEHKGHGRLSVKAPAVPAVVIPGYYMLFVLNGKGVPSVAKLVHFSVPK